MTTDHARDERQRFLRDIAVHGSGFYRIDPREIYRPPESEVQLTRKEFYGWLVRAFCYGAVTITTLAIALGFV